MENFDAVIFQNVVQAMVEAQAVAPGNILPERGQDAEYVEWVRGYGTDAVHDSIFRSWC